MPTILCPTLYASYKTILDYIYPIFSFWETIEKTTAQFIRKACNDIDFNIIPKILKMPEELI
jgi:hypothetical protein